MFNSPEFIYFVILIAFIFDFLNGLHDASNSIATIVATKVLKPLPAVMWAAFFNMIAFLFFKLNVANTISAGLLTPNIITPYLIFCALIGSISWNLITWYFGLPSSSSHALIGGLIGSAIVSGGWNALNWNGLWPTLVALVVSPVLGLLISAILVKFLRKFLLPESTNEQTSYWGRISQFIASAFLSLGHGGNDAQKTMGLISILLFSGDLIGNTFYVPLWVILSCNLVMGLGTLCGGWRIIETMGEKITPLTTVSGGCATTGAAFTLLLANELGVPISTTHTVTGAIIGSSFFQGRKNIYWSTVYRIVWSWLLTIPFSAILSGVTMFIGGMINASL